MKTILCCKTVHILLQFEFKRTFREHAGVNAIKCTHTCLQKTYEFTVKLIYNILLVVPGFFLAIVWGCFNSFTAFLQTWIISPLLRVSIVLVKGLLPMILEPTTMILKAAMDVICNRVPNPAGQLGNISGGPFSNLKAFTGVFGQKCHQ